ncbi:hypothetical protein C8F01DRAFT_625760 [Mycena amicta]|nr:hypothetical protein C8F01DRAFT_625760 [Mycena amicta]
MSAPVFDPNATFGALLIGGLASTLLFGVTSGQFYFYYTHFPEDAVIKAMVSFVWLAEATHVGCVFHTLYTWLVTDYGHPESLLERPPHSFLAFTFLAGIITACVQVFFSYRIYVLSRSIIIPCLAYTLSFGRFIISMVVFSITLSTPSIGEFITRWNKLSVTIWSLSAAEDIIITVTLVSLLRMQRGRMHHDHTTALLDKIIMWTIETGVLTSTFSLAQLVCFHVMPGNFVWVALFIVQARLFANSLFASFNSRFILRGIRHDTGLNGQLSLSLPALQARNNTFSQPQEISVEMQKSTESGRNTKFE